MNHEYLATSADGTDGDAGNNLILVGSDHGKWIEMTLDNHMQLQIEMQRALDDPLQALMVEVANEYRQMTPARAAR